MAFSREQIITFWKSFWVPVIISLVFVCLAGFLTGRHFALLSQTPPAEEENSAALSQWVDEPPQFEGEPDTGEPEEEEWPVLPPPPPASMEQIKKQGCVADGFLSGYGGDLN